MNTILWEKKQKNKQKTKTKKQNKTKQQQQKNKTHTDKKKKDTGQSRQHPTHKYTLSILHFPMEPQNVSPSR